ncbi:MAG: methylated-DNA--[protein]-cysteine S-methyltransferase [Candidatus Thorarchaeota archaeon]|jgi:O-6-methylguanine DNA methyltransferase
MIDKSKIKTEADIRRALAGRSEFEKDVYMATFKIPRGMVSTYGRIAKKIGRPKAVRAVASTLRKNPLHPVVPCHRVVKADGGFGGNPKRAAGRRKNVEEEGVPIEDGKVKLSKDIIY